MEQSDPEIPLSAVCVVERIFEAATLEDAIHWRQEMVDRLGQAIADGRLSLEERSMYELARSETLTAIERLRICLESDDRPIWPRAASTSP